MTHHNNSSYVPAAIGVLGWASMSQSQNNVFVILCSSQPICFTDGSAPSGIQGSPPGNLAPDFQATVPDEGQH